MKKIISLILAVALVIALCAVSSFAEGGMAYQDRENVALDAYVEAWDGGGANANLEMLDWFTIMNLVDGRLDSFDGDTTNTEQSLAWYTVSDSRNTQIAALVDLGKEYSIGEVYLYPTKFLEGTPTPSTFTVSIATDEADWDVLESENWTTIGSESKLKDNVKRSDPFVYNGNGQKARFLRIYITRTSGVSDGKYYAGFGELEVYEYVEPPLNVRDFNAETDKQYFDRILVNGELKAEGNEAVAELKANVDGSDGSIQNIGMYGWFGLVDDETPFSDQFVSFGYIIDDGAPVFSADFTAETAQDVLDLNGLRYMITADVSGLTDGETHTIKGCVKLANNDLVIFNRENREAVISYKAPFVATPEPTAEPTPTPEPETATSEPADPTAAPDAEESAKPSENKTDSAKKGGCGGVIGGGIALLAVAAVLALRKKR